MLDGWPVWDSKYADILVTGALLLLPVSVGEMGVLFSGCFSLLRCFLFGLGRSPAKWDEGM